MKNFLRVAFPWIFAGVWCIAFVLFVFLSPYKPNENVQITEVSTLGSMMIQGATPTITPITERLIAKLPFTPKMRKTDSPLVASVIENHQDARPHQRGLRDAIAVFELIVEGDITRFLAFFRADRLPSQIGPVRSLREFMVSIALGYKPLILHIGGHPYAYDALKNNPELIHHDGIRYDGETYERDENAKAPHNLFMKKEPLKQLLEKISLTEFTLPIFETGSLPSGSESATKIMINMGSPNHDVTFTYKSLFRSYTRSVANAPKQAQPKTIAILETTVDGFNQRGYIPWTKTFDGGAMLLFRNGKIFEGTWQRKKGEPFVFLDSKGDVLPVSIGQVWVTMLPSLRMMVSWE